MSDALPKVSFCRCPKCGLEIPSTGWEGLCPRCLVLVSVCRTGQSPVHSEAGSGTGSEEVNGNCEIELQSPPRNGAREPGLAEETAAAAGVLVCGSGQRFGDYHLLDEVGRGGMGVVFKARQQSLNRIVAVKILLGGPSAGGPQLERFRTEAEAVAQLQHPNIVAIYEAGQFEGVPFFSMEYVPGHTLADLVAQKPLPPEKAAQYVLTIAGAIHFAHQHGILHRDLKPSNVLIDTSGRPRVTDFGLAKRLASALDPTLPDLALTITGQVLGSPSYVAPEQAGARRGTVGRHSDVYALGALLFHLLTGRPPFLSESLEGTLLQVLTTEPIGARRLNPDVPRDLETICTKCLQKEPGRRYASAAALADDLRRFLDRQPILARPANPVQKLWRWSRRRPALSATLLLLHVALAAGAAGILWAWQQAVEGWHAARQHLYAADMLLAQQAIEAQQPGRAVELLEKHNPRTATAAGGGSPFKWRPSALTDLRGWEWYYFRSLCASDELATLGTHTNAVTVIAFAPGGDRLATGDIRGGLKLWDVRARRELAARYDSHEQLLALAFSPDGRLLAMGGDDERVRIYEASNLRPVFAPLVHSNSVVALEFSPDGRRLRACSRDELVWWDVKEARRLEQKQIEAGFSAVLAPGRDLVAVPARGRFRLLDTASGRVTVRDTGAQVVSALAFSPDGSRLYAGCDGCTRGWDLSQDKEIPLIPVHSLQIHSLTVSPDGRLLATGASDESIRVWDALNGSVRGVLRGQNSPVWAVTFAPNGQMLGSGGKDGRVKLWPIQPSADRTVAFPFGPRTGRYYMAPDASGLEWWDLGGRLCSFDWQTRQFAPARPFEANSDGCMAITPGGKIRAVDEGHGTVSLWSRDTNKRLGLLQGASDPVRAMTFSPDGKVLAMGGLRGEAQLWDVPNRRLLRSLRALAESLTGRFCFSADGRQLAAGYWDGRTTLWRLDGRNDPEPAIWQTHQTRVHAEAFSPDGLWLCTVAGDGLARLWETLTRRQIAQLSVSPVDVFSAAFSPDGRRLAVCAGDGVVTLYDLSTLQPIAHFHEHAEPSLHALAFTSDGTSLVSASLQDIVVRRVPVDGQGR